MTLPGPEFRNRRSVPWADVPRREVEAFRAEVVAAVAAGARLVSLFGLPEDERRTGLVAVLADDARAALGAVRTVVGPAYPALTPDCPEAHLFEREIAEQCDVAPEGHPWLKPVRRHPPDHRPPQREPGLFDRAGDAPFDREAYPFFRAGGDEVHEVAVGPVHAGIIEPGHFRFHAHGEDVLFLEIVLGYQHRGVECLLETLPPVGAMRVAESIAGDTVIGHAEAYCGALEALSRCHKGPRAQAVRGCALELERLACHIGDLGALAGDVAFAPTAAICGRVRGDVLNLLLELSGNRFGRGLVRPGGVAFDLPPAMADGFRARLEVIGAELEQAAGLFFGSESVQARIEGTGVVPAASCRELGFVGPTARAADVARDVRSDHPWGIHRFAHIPTATASTGDVAARAMVRVVEARRSIEFLLEQLAALPRSASVRTEPGALAPAELVVALAEGWRGEIAHVAVTDAAGAVRRWKVTDPSFHDWTALSVAMAGTPISDFPLCNKSFNLSYAGHDL
jgi:Ni,Fe-hydrogenase III large subunit